MEPATQLPADHFLDQVLSALTVGDAAALRRLESLAPMVSAPSSLAQYRSQCGVLESLLDATGRNLRTLRRAVDGRASGLYAPEPR